MKPELRKFAAAFATWRKVAGISQEKAAKLFRVSLYTISNWERGLSYPQNIDFVEMIAGRKFPRTTARRPGRPRLVNPDYTPSWMM
jgi:transcriptional regulator with XRE-family HTH domain